MLHTNLANSYYSQHCLTQPLVNSTNALNPTIYSGHTPWIPYVKSNQQFQHYSHFNTLLNIFAYLLVELSGYDCNECFIFLLSLNYTIYTFLRISTLSIVQWRTCIQTNHSYWSNSNWSEYHRCIHLQASRSIVFTTNLMYILCSIIKWHALLLVCTVWSFI